MPGNRCAAKWCRKCSVTYANLTFYRFPTDDRATAWIEYANRADLGNISREQLNRTAKLCACHFTQDAFKKSGPHSMGIYRRLKESAVPTVPVSDPALRIFVPPQFYNGPKPHDGPETVRLLPPRLLCEHNYCSSESRIETMRLVPHVLCDRDYCTTQNIDSSPSSFLAVNSQVLGRPVDIESGAPLATTSHSSSGPAEYRAVPSTSTATIAAPPTSSSGPAEYRAVPSTSTATIAAPPTSSSGPSEYRAVPSTSTATIAAPPTSSSGPSEYRAVPSTSTATIAAPPTSSSGPSEYRAVPSTSTATIAAPPTSHSDPFEHLAVPSTSTTRASPFPSHHLEGSHVPAPAATLAPRQETPVKKRKGRPKKQTTPRTKRQLHHYRIENARLRRTLSRMKPARPVLSRAQIISEAARYLNKDFLDILRVQMYLQPSNKYGRRWPPEFRQFALNLYCNSPKAYRYLAKVLSLPTVTSLRTWLPSINSKPGACPQVLELLKEKK
ncbi:uncharacterized protein LOC144154933 isoform X3 [Haemaphysalis longicornis]